MRRLTWGFLALLSISSSAAACAPGDDEGDASQEAISRPDLRARFADLRKVNSDNLARLAVNVGADSLNRALSVRSKYVDLGIEVKDTNVFGRDAEDNSLVPKDGKVKSLEEIRKGLAADFGETELPTELTKIRLEHLSKGEAKYYIE